MKDSFRMIDCRDQRPLACSDGLSGSEFEKGWSRLGLTIVTKFQITHIVGNFTLWLTEHYGLRLRLDVL